MSKQHTCLWVVILFVFMSRLTLAADTALNSVDQPETQLTQNESHATPVKDLSLNQGTSESVIANENTTPGTNTVSSVNTIRPPKGNTPGVNSTDWLKAILGLIAIVALIFAIAWFVKRFTGLAVSNQQQMRIISAIPVGAKERIALVEVADKQLLVGITQHNINLLHSFEEPVVNKNDKTAVDFSSRLQAILSKSAQD